MVVIVFGWFLYKIKMATFCARKKQRRGGFIKYIINICKQPSPYVVAFKIE